MISYEELEKIVNGLKDKLDETTSALISDDLVNIISNYKLGIDEIAELNENIKSLQSEKDELLKVNGKLFQKVGFENKEEKKEDDTNNDEEIDIDEVINEKGEII